MAMDFIGLSVGMGYTDETVIGGGALKGKNCVVSNIEEVANGVNVTFQWTLDDGTVKTETVLLPKGTQGEAGVAGKSAYEIWLEAGNTGTEEDFLISLVGEKGDDGKSAYQYAQDGGYIGTETEFTTNIARSGVISKELEVERARIDNLTTLQDGSTTGDAELIDARVKANGKVSTSAGNAVREQISEIREDIENDKLQIVKGNVEVEIIDNVSINTSTGALVTNPTVCACFKVTKGYKYKWVANNATRNVVAFYTSKPKLNDVSFNASFVQINQDTLFDAQINGWCVVYFNNANDIEATNSFRVSIYNCIEEQIRNINVGDIQNNVMKLMQAINISENTDNIFNYDENEVLDLVVNQETLKFVTDSSIKSVACPIKPNSIVTVSMKQSNRFVIATSKEKVKVGGTATSAKFYSGSNITSYTFVTGENDNYIFITFIKPSDTSLTQEEIGNSIKIFYGTVEGTENINRLTTPNESSILMMDDNAINLSSYRAIGALKKGYVAITCDDGRYALATYTLPKMKQWVQTYGKNIPITMGLFDTCEVLSNDEYKAEVIECLNNYGCSVGLHGLNPFTMYTRKQLYDYLKKQDRELTNILGVRPSSVLYVSHAYNTEVKTICGSFYGVCGTGGNIHELTYSDPNGNYWYSGDRSNMYSIYRFSIFNQQMTKEKIKNAVDYAYENNVVLCPFFHDINLTENVNGELSTTVARELLDYLVEYGISKGIEFISFGDIPNIL